MKYFVYQLDSDKGKSYHKTAAQTLYRAINNIMSFEGCPKTAITIYRVHELLWTLSAKSLFDQRDKQVFESIF